LRSHLPTSTARSDFSASMEVIRLGAFAAPAAAMRTMRLRRQRLQVVLASTMVLYLLAIVVDGCISTRDTGSRSVAPPHRLQLPSRTDAFALPRRSALSGAALLSAAPRASAASASGENGSVEPVATLQLQKVIAETLLDDWKLQDYEAMRDDQARTSRFEAAIRRRLAGLEGRATVVDIGTGSFALLAVMAAQAGARKVYAIEKNKAAAERAKEWVRFRKLQDKIDIIEGDSMTVELPEKVDFVVSELIGSIATQEGVEPIIRDASQRFLKPKPAEDPRPQMIPARCQTCIAPVEYKDHDWYQWKRGLQSRGKPEPGSLRPLRLESRTRDLTFLSEPQLLEDFDYATAGTAERSQERHLTFELPAAATRRFSGFAMWSRVVVDEEDVVEVSGQKSHWAYVVALMSEKPVDLAPTSGRIELDSRADYATLPVRYELRATVPVPASALAPVPA